MTNITVVPYGAKSALSRWLDLYWSPRDRKAFPWLCVIVLLAFLFFGPQFLLWLVGFLPADQLGNSGASIFAHQIILLIATLLAAIAAGLLLRPLLQPRLLELSPEGVRLVWGFWIIHLRGRGLPWADIISVHLVQPGETTDPRLCQLQFGTAKNAAAIKIPLGQLEGDESRQAVADCIAKYTLHAVEPRVFSELAPQRSLSFTELWLDALSAPPSRERLLPLEDGAILDGRYRILSRLGSGGQGTVYLAEDNKGEESKGENFGHAPQVVLKESILPVYADLVSRRQALEAFHKEAFALEAVKHEHIVRFLGSFVADHRAYLVLDFVQGKTLSELVKNSGPIENARVVTLTQQMCDILAHLHAQSPPMVHRDFTPDNLIVGADDKITLIDFAVSVSAASSGAEPSSEVAGKAAYMAPEQFKGRPQAQSDVYSLGATMYYLLTGETPEPLGESHPILANDRVDKTLSDIVAGATSLQLSQRYPTAEAVKSALQPLSL